MHRKYLPLFILALLTPMALGGCVRPPALSEPNIPVLPTATATPDEVAGVTADATVEEPVEEPATVAAEPTEESVVHYQGPDSYGATLRFDVAYDTAIWEYVEDDGSGRQSQLKHRTDPGCTIWLRAGPVDATEVATVWLAERAWTLSQVQSHIIQYSAPEGDISWIFGVLLPEEYSGMGNSSCQDAAERVIDTFTIVE